MASTEPLAEVPRPGPGPEPLHHSGPSSHGEAPLSNGCFAFPVHDLREEDERFSREPGLSQGFAYRAFSKMTEGGLRNSIFTLVSTSVGGGVLAIPYMFRLCGFGYAIILLMLGAVVANETMYILMVAAHKASCPTYAALMGEACGTHSALLLDIVCGLYGCGAIVSYLIFLGEFIPGSFEYMGFTVSRTVAIWGTCLIGTPMAMPKSLKALRYVSPFATIALGLTAFVALYKAAMDGVQSPEITTHSAFHVDLNIFQCFGIATFSFMCHLNVVPVSVEMQFPSDRRLRKVTARVSGVEVVFYSAIGIAGYYSFGSLTKQNFISNYPADDVLAFIVRVALSCTIFFGVPINMSPTAKSLANVCRYFATSHEDRDRLVHGHLGSPHRLLRYVCVVVLMGLSGLIATFCTNVADVIGLLGGTLGTFLLAVVPLFVYKRVLTTATNQAPTPLLSPNTAQPGSGAQWRPPYMLVVSVLTVISAINIFGSIFIFVYKAVTS